MTLHFYHCDICGKNIAVLSEADIPTSCCGQTMKELVPNQTDGAFEKHVPVFRKIGHTVTVRVGSVPHPMTEEHSITWIGLRTSGGFQFRELHPGDSPEAVFLIENEDQAEAVYAYCNLHGFWISEKESEE